MTRVSLKETQLVAVVLYCTARSNLLSGLGEGLGQPLAPFTCGAAWQEEQPIEKVGGRRQEITKGLIPSLTPSTSWVCVVLIPLHLQVWKVSAVLQSQGWACVFTPTGVLGPKVTTSPALWRPLLLTTTSRHEACRSL